jgi:hypothetical protein
MYKVYYEVGDDNEQHVRDYKNLKWALRFAQKQHNNPDTGWIDITNHGAYTEWHHKDVEYSNFKWRNGQMVEYTELPEWMLPAETAT